MYMLLQTGYLLWNHTWIHYFCHFLCLVTIQPVFNFRYWILPFQNVHLILLYTFQFILSMLSAFPLFNVWIIITLKSFPAMSAIWIIRRSALIVHFFPFNYWSHFPALHISCDFLLYATLSLFIQQTEETKLDVIFFHRGLPLPWQAVRLRGEWLMTSIQ